jgi:hypothetical protein
MRRFMGPPEMGEIFVKVANGKMAGAVKNAGVKASGPAAMLRASQS